MNTTVNEGVLQIYIEMKLLLPKLQDTIAQFEKLVYEMKLNQQHVVDAAEIETYYQTSVQLQSAKEEASKIEERYHETEGLIVQFMQEHKIEHITAHSQKGDAYSISAEPGANTLVLTAVEAN